MSSIRYLRIRIVGEHGGDIAVTAVGADGKEIVDGSWSLFRAEEIEKAALTAQQIRGIVESRNPYKEKVGDTRKHPEPHGVEQEHRGVERELRQGEGGLPLW